MNDRKTVDQHSPMNLALNVLLVSCALLASVRDIEASSDQAVHSHEDRPHPLIVTLWRFVPL